MTAPIESAPASDRPPSAGGAAFPTTHWSIVVRANEPSTEQARNALETLCRQYWYPLYVFARRQGRTREEAEDATQGFFARLLETGALARARQERGRFRTFLLTSFRNFMVNDWKRAAAIKRGSRCPMLPLDFAGADRTFEREPADPGLTPERAFDRNWAAGMIEQVISGLRDEYEKSGRGELFRVLGPMIWGGATGESHRERAARLGVNEHAFTMALHRLRIRLGDRLRARVAETVAHADDVEDELRYLISAVSS